MLYFHWIVALVVTLVLGAHFVEIHRPEMALSMYILALITFVIIFATGTEYGIKPLKIPSFPKFKLPDFFKRKPSIPTLDEVKKKLLKY